MSLRMSKACKTHTSKSSPPVKHILRRGIARASPGKPQDIMEIHSDSRRENRLDESATIRWCIKSIGESRNEKSAADWLRSSEKPSGSTPYQVQPG
jgi:hypothetical protein